MHWADVEAEELPQRPLIATGVAPSGPLHLGALKELLTGELISRAADGRLILIVDSMDPLRKVYPFLDESYEAEIGKPLSEIPCPCGEHENYSEHYLEPFLDSLNRLGIEADVRSAHKMYSEGEYESATRKMIQRRETVASIIGRETGRELGDDWFPYNPLCSRCNSLSSTEVKGFEDPYVIYTCGCGHQGKADIRKGDGKLPWRCDWPARWWILGVDCEPFGKDHAASGGSWDTGKPMIEEVLKSEAPHPVVYEWIHLKGQGPMSSSTGVAIAVEDLINIVGPEVVRFLIARSKPSTHIDFDPGLGVLDLVDDYDSYDKRYFDDELEKDDRRVFELSQVDGVPEKFYPRVPYRHLVNLVQIYSDDREIWEVVKESEHFDKPGEEDNQRMKDRAERVRYWLDRYAPDFVKFSLKEEMPEVSLSAQEKEFLKDYYKSLKEEEWKPDRLHKLVHENAEEIGLSKGKAFRAFYKILLGKEKGPRLGRFLTQLDRDFLMERLDEAF